ncbi:TadE/TadG family type IV pilus assembly protein [Gemmata sp.]|uniref:TadE/TadG family type IV pilus assembly protein n=1 Tax=Gemmata sp. TaxID=1914242 RepID=UPI003F71AA30
MTHAHRRRGPARRAVAAAELALVLPLLVVLIGGCVDFGRFSHVNITVTNAARAGAEFGGTHPCTAATLDLWEQNVRRAVADEMGGLKHFDPAHLTVTVARVTAGDAPRVEVDVSYPFETVGRWPGLPARLTLRRVVAVPMSRP